MGKIGEIKSVMYKGTTKVKNRTRDFFKPKLTYHLKGREKVYQNILGTETKYTFSSESMFQKIGNTDVVAMQTERAHSLPQDLYEKGSDRKLRSDVPITHQFFTKTKNYLFGLINGEQKAVETINIGRKAVLRSDASMKKGKIISNFVFGPVPVPERKSLYDNSKGSVLLMFDKENLHLIK